VIKKKPKHCCFGQAAPMAREELAAAQSDACVCFADA
jgi:hypothetical protein